MCFSNLPIEFDEEGNPFLADEAEEVQRPGCGCSDGVEVALEEDDPRAAFEDIVETVPPEVRSHLEDTTDTPSPHRKAGSD